MKFTKMQGIGNDYVYVNCFEETVKNPEQLAVKISDRHLGVGSDGLILIEPSEVADCRMHMFNADGTESEMCGNGIRCVGKYVYDHKIAPREEITVETKAGIKKLTLKTRGEKAEEITVDMGIPQVTSRVPEPICVGGRDYSFVGISVGNPHAVYFVEDLDGLDLEKIGPSFERHERFPERTNTEFVQVLSPGRLRMRVWERGSGETMACGTGATASAVAAALTGVAEDTAEVELKGGRLVIRWDRESGHVFMTGPAVEVFCGELNPKEL